MSQLKKLKALIEEANSNTDFISSEANALETISHEEGQEAAQQIKIKLQEAQFWLSKLI